jgi:adenylate cyclase
MLRETECKGTGTMTMLAEPREQAETTARTFAPKFGPFSFAATLGFCMGLLVLLAVATVLAVQYSASRTTTFKFLNDKAEAIVQQIEFDIRHHLDPAADQVEFIAQQIESGAYDLNDTVRLADLLTGSLAAVPQIAAIASWDTNLRRVGVRREANGTSLLTQIDPDDQSAVEKAARDLADVEGPFWGELVFSGVTLINLRRPLRRDGELIGFLVTVISVPGLSELITDTGDRFDATAFILYGRDRVLAHPFLTAVHSEQSRENPVVALNNVGDLILSNMWDNEAVAGFEQAAAQSVNVVQSRIAGQSYVFIYKWIDDYGAVPWALGAWFPVADVSAELERLWLSGLVGIAVLLLAIAAAVILARLIAKPIRKVAANAMLVGDLDLNRVNRLPPSAIRELNDQARAFNTMLGGLRAFETYVPRSLVTRLIGRSGDRGVVSEERELTVMFTDIADFTAMSEHRPASDVADFLNEHFALLGACVEAQDGTVDKFIGDALMAFWGAPDAQEDTAARACCAALAIARAIGADNAKREAAGKPPIRMRIGIHSGPVVVGNVGWPGRINYTIVGDTVNTCQRLESMGKQADQGDAVTILISGTTARLLDNDFTFEPAGTFRVKGKAEEVEVFRLVV